VAARAQRVAQFLDGRIGHLAEELLDQSGLCLDPAGAAIPAEWAGLGVTPLPLQCPPTADTGWADTEPRRSFPMAGTISNKGENANPKIDRQGFRHARRPPFPGRQFESYLRRVGYPFRFSQEGFRSRLRYLWTCFGKVESS
jgi:hypothetical protein